MKTSGNRLLFCARDWQCSSKTDDELLPERMERLLGLSTKESHLTCFTSIPVHQEKVVGSKAIVKYDFESTNKEKNQRHELALMRARLLVALFPNEICVRPVWISLHHANVHDILRHTYRRIFDDD